MINKLMFDAFNDCDVKDGSLMFSPTANFTRDEQFLIYNKFMEDFLNYNIPHYRVIGVKFINDLLESSLIKFQPSYNCSYTDIIMESSYIIPDSIGGNDLNDFCFIPHGMSHPNKDKIDNIVDRIDILKFDLEECGQLVYKSDIHGEHNNSIFSMYDEVKEDEEKVKMDVKYIDFLKYSLATRNKPNYLIPNHFITKVDSSTFVGHETYFFYKKGTGIVDFAKNAKLFTKESGVVPCRTKYDLTEFILCKYLDDSCPKNTLQFHYTVDINESALTKILREYGKDFGQA